jgi:choline-sulfatase
VANAAARKLYDLARGRDPRPWCLTVSFTHPHDPYVARPPYWDLYENCPALDPVTAPIPYAALDPHGKRLHDVSDHRAYDIRPEDVRRARRAYFANISYLDDQIGRLLHILSACGMDEDTAIVFLGDHGDLLGERGLWYKMTFLEPASRIPLMIRAPGRPAGRIEVPVSAIDLVATLADLAGIAPEQVAPWHDGTSLASGDGWIAARAPVEMEYAAEGSVAPMVAIRDGRWKYVACPADPPQLFDLASDPHELVNLAADPAHSATAETFAARVAARWDLAAFDADVRRSQARRHLVYAALRQGAYTPWDHQPRLDATNRFMRNHMDLNEVEAGQRVPRPTT